MKNMSVMYSSHVIVVHLQVVLVGFSIPPLLWFAFHSGSAFAWCEKVLAILAALDLCPFGEVVAFSEAIGHLWWPGHSVVVRYVAGFDMLLLVLIKLFGISSEWRSALSCSRML